VMMPLVAADKARLDDLRPLAQQVATQTGVPVKLVRFARVADLETILP